MFEATIPAGISPLDTARTALMTPAIPCVLPECPNCETSELTIAAGPGLPVSRTLPSSSISVLAKSSDAPSISMPAKSAGAVPEASKARSAAP